MVFRIRKLIRKGVQKKAFNTGNLFKGVGKSLKGKRQGSTQSHVLIIKATFKVVLPEPRSQGPAPVKLAGGPQCKPGL